MVKAVERGVTRAEDADDALLTVALAPGESPPAREALTNLQRRAIRAVARKTFYHPTIVLALTNSVLARHGLPNTRREIEHFLGEPLCPRKPWWRFW
jgi:hypothetical protein